MQTNRKGWLDAMPPGKRDSSIELLRIIAMLMIVFHHFAVHSSYIFSGFSIKTLWYNFIVGGGKTGANIFVLISGYYLILDEKNINFKKIISIWMEVFFYSVTILIVYCCFGGNVSIQQVIKSLFPITFSLSWFVGAYFVLYLLHPYINIMLRKMDVIMYQNLLLLLVMLWSIIPTITTSSLQSNNLVWFVFLYAVAGYIRLYGLNNKIRNNHYLLICIIVLLFSYMSVCILEGLGYIIPQLLNYTTYFYGQEKVTTFLFSVGIFCFFLNIKIPYNKWINKVATTTFGIYLIHDNGIIRDYLWNELLDVNSVEGMMYIFYSIIVVLSIFCICSIIDLIRQIIFKVIYGLFFNNFKVEYAFIRKAILLFRKIL